MKSTLNINMLKNIIKEEVSALMKNEIGVYYHGTRSILPFEFFDKISDGSGIVSSGKKYGGFFFTDEKDNAQFFTEWFVCKVKIKNIQENPYNEKHPPAILKKAAQDNKKL